ncbi:MAG: peptidoglycan-binding protein [Rhodobacteraceae bacterium]|nr:peptidoglycan-binding protein [Paracoccaceae bacterium]
MFKKIAFIGLFLLSPIGLIAQENQIKIVALVLTTAEYNPSSDNILAALDSLNAQTLRVDSPNASELRAVIKRFAAVAIDNDIALVFADGPILKLGEREFLAPSDFDLRRGTDLLTRAIPLSALARATALAGDGGAVFVHSSDLGKPLPDEVHLVQLAPDFRSGTSPVLLGQAGSAMAMAEIFETHTDGEEMDLSRLLTDLISRVEFTVSYIPGRSMIIKKPALVIPVITAPAGGISNAADQDAVKPGDNSANADENIPVNGEDGTNVIPEAQSSRNAGGLNLPQIQSPAAGQPVVEPELEIVDAEAGKPLSLEVLEALQSGLSRADKRTIQHGLRDVGFYSGLIDGVFGNQTKAAIEAYQRSIDADVTGVLSVSQMDGFLN